MSVFTATVLLRRPFTTVDSGRVTDLLRRYAGDVMETRKGRHWTFIFDNAAASLSVLNTATHSCDFEDDLLANNLDYDDAPDAFVLAVPTWRKSECDKFCALVHDLARMFDGVDCGIH